jgi:16S rRNA (cytosine967-C5)-methyltransferase
MREWNARYVAYDILKKLESHQSNSAVLLQNSLTSIANPADRRLITDLVLGTLRWRERLLHIIQKFSRRGLGSVDQNVLILLQLGVYQLLFTGIPEHAAIYETVNLSKRIRMTSASSFINGILRAVQNKKNTELLPAAENTKSLSIVYSHPEWLVKRWLNHFGKDDAQALMQRNNEPAQVYLRVNELRITSETVIQHIKDEGISAIPVAPGSPVLLVKEGAPQLTNSFEEGEFYIHDAGIESIGQLMKASPGQSVLEIAAAPGGKTLQLAMRMNDKGLILSVDSDLKRMKMWRRNIDRLKIKCAVPVVADARNLPLNKTFDLVTIDAPCSSLGTIRRHPEIKWWRQESELKKFHEMQLQILDSCAKYVGVAGSLVYLVCSFEPEETEEVTKEFLQAHPEFIEEERKTLLPHRDNTDGFFAVRLKRR